MAKLATSRASGAFCLGEEEEGDETGLLDASARRGEHGGRGKRRRRRRAPLGRMQGESRGGGGARECYGRVREVVGNEGGVRVSLGSLQRRAGKQEVAGALRARATPRLCLLAEEEEDKEGGGLGRLGGGNWAGWAARVRPGRLHSFYLFFLSVLF